MVFLLLGFEVALATSAARAERVAFLDVTVLPMAGPARLRHQTVIVNDGVIETIAPARSVRVPDGVTRLDGRTRFLLPGLSDFHAHLDWSLSIPGGDARSPDAHRQIVLLSYLATGVTLVRDMSGSPTRLLQRDAIARGEQLGPAIVVASPIVEGAQRVWGASLTVTEPEQAAEMVDRLRRDGYDQIKVYHTISAPVYESILAAAKHAGLEVVGHVPFDVGIERALDAGQRSIEHLRGYDFDRLDRALLDKDGGRSPERMSSWTRMLPARQRELAAATAKARVWNVPTYVINRYLAEPEARAALADDPRYALLPPITQAAIRSASVDVLFPAATRAAIRESMPAARTFARALYDAGAPLLIGTDTPVPFLVRGFTPIDEMADFVAAGIPILDVLRMATVAPARFVPAHAPCRRVAVGERCDLILVAADPLLDVANLWQLDGVLRAGRWHTTSALLNDIATLRRTLGEP